MYETSNKSNKIWLEGLNPHILKNERVNLFKILKLSDSKILVKIKGLTTYLIQFFIVVYSQVTK